MINEPLEIVDSVLEFWFGELDQDGLADSAHQRNWFVKDPSFDEAIENQFGEAIESAYAGEFDAALSQPRGRLALIILLDQFCRNVFRDTDGMFSRDPSALAWAKDGLSLEQDQALKPVERVFFYLPFEHSEAADDQETSIAVFSALAEEVSDAASSVKQYIDSTLDYAYRHKAIIDKFGRYPHRNQLLGRESTAEEVEFLAGPNSGF